MRVLHFYKTAFPSTFGGVEQVIHQIARCSNEFGIQSEVLSLSKDYSPRTVHIDGYLSHREREIINISSTGFSISVISRFIQLAKKADVIHYHFPWPFMDLLHFSLGLNKPTIVTYHSDIIRQKYLLKLYRPLMLSFLNSVDRIIATSPNYYETSKVLNKFENKVQIIPIGLDKDSYPEPGEEKLEYWKTRFNAKFFLFVGALRYYKGINTLLEAVHGTEYPLLILGAGPIETELKVEAIQLGLKNVFFLGQLPDEDKVALLKLCYGVVFPSNLRSEAFGVSLLEGAMYGKALISCEIGTGTSFVNIANQTGLVVPPNNPLALRNAMRYLWENPEITALMGKEAKARYLNLFTASTMVEQYVKAYKEIAKLPN